MQPPEPTPDAPGAGGQKRFYDAYHRALAAGAQVRATFGRGLLLDIHGQGRGRRHPPGTNNGRAVAQLVRRYGGGARTRSIFGLQGKGYRIIPPLVAGAREDQLDGGYTVQTYGSGRGGTMDAIQLEFGAELRKTKNLDKTASDVAAAVAEFAKEYLPLEAPRRNQTR
jgi:N-formylglutamate amidohydrolase